jgi:hypothetical protein
MTLKSLQSALALPVFFLVISCARQALNAPQSGAVEGGFSNIKSGVATAETQRGQIVQANTSARSISRTVQDKDALIDAYHKYKATHPKPSPTP